MTSTTSSDTRRPRLSPHYWRLWRANAISSTRGGAFLAAPPLLPVPISRDPRLVAVVTAAGFFPWMVLSLPAGALVDRYDRATLMWRAQAVQAAVVAVVAVAVIFRIANIAVLGLAGLLLGSAEVVFSNAAQAVLPDLVPPELLARANGSQQVSLTVGETFLGPPAGSLLFAVAAALPFGLDALSFAGSAAQLARLPRGSRAAGREARGAAGGRAGSRAGGGRPPPPGPRRGGAGCPGPACCASPPSCSAFSTPATRGAGPSGCCCPPRRCTSGPAGTGCCWR